MALLNVDHPEQTTLNPEDLIVDTLQRQQQKQKAAQICKRICGDLTPRQNRIFQLRLDGKTFKEIAFALDCSTGRIYTEWKTIRAIAWRYYQPLD